MEIKIKNTPYIEDGEVGLQELSAVYVQEPNTDDDQDHYQYLKITTVDCPGADDNPEDPPYYYNLEILPFDDGTPGHWSVEDADEFAQIFSDFKQRVINAKNIKHVEEKK